MAITARSPLNDFLASLATGLKAHSRRGRYLVGVSGGRDSVALLHGLIALGFRNLVVCHFNHGLRGAASRGDARFVEKLAKALSLPCETGAGKTSAYAKEKRISTETAARQLRHAFLSVCAKKHRTRKVLLAHHAEDQAETCLFNYLRGAGMAGLSGMKPVSTVAVQRVKLEMLRPMLAIFRSSLEEYLKENNLKYREDASNADLSYSRNRIRHRVLAYLEKEMGRDVRKSILRTSEILAAEEEWMRDEAEETILSAQLAVKDLREMPLALRRRVLRRWFLAQGVPEPDYADVEGTLKLLEPEAAVAKANLPRGIHVRRRAGKLFLEFPQR